ncbi:MAG: hypothetical protein ABUK01_12780 [Leptospirales bacterium]
MPKIIINKKLDITVQSTMEIFKMYFPGKYEFYMTHALHTEFIIKKSAWTGVAVIIKVKPEKTTIRCMGLAPSVFVRIFLMGLIPMLILYFVSWKKMQNEVKEFIENRPEFK